MTTGTSLTCVRLTPLHQGQGALGPPLKSGECPDESLNKSAKIRDQRQVVLAGVGRWEQWTGPEGKFGWGGQQRLQGDLGAAIHSAGFGRLAPKKSKFKTVQTVGSLPNLHIPQNPAVEEVYDLIIISLPHLTRSKRCPQPRLPGPPAGFYHRLTFGGETFDPNGKPGKEPLASQRSWRGCNCGTCGFHTPHRGQAHL